MSIVFTVRPIRENLIVIHLPKGNPSTLYKLQGLKLLLNKLFTADHSGIVFENGQFPENAYIFMT